MRTLELEGIGRRFGAVQALADVGLALRAGEVHALMGENGAGKSTLIRILAGLERPDAGTIALDGRAIAPGSPAAMRASGLRFVHQELQTVPGLTVAENMHLDHPCPTRLGLIDWRALNGAAAEALGRLGLRRIDPRAPITDYGTGDRMLVRIAATLIGGEGAWLYVMDEPTAALTEAEAEHLFAVIGGLVRGGAGVLYVSHRMPEVLRLAHRVSVLREGRHISTRPRTETGQARIIAEMTGRDLGTIFPPRPPRAAGTPAVLRATALVAPGIGPVDLAVTPGEVLGIAGLAGSGRGALLRALAGALPARGGQVELDGIRLANGSGRAWRAGIAYVPRERRSEGLMVRRAIFENVALPHLAALARWGVMLDHARQRNLAEGLGVRVLLRAAGVGQPCAELSGGNQQKVLFARAIGGKPRVLLLDEPTRGVDIGARHDIYRLIRDLCAEGVAVVIASSDLPELIGLSDRIMLMHRGRPGGMLAAEGLTEAGLLGQLYALAEEAA